MIPHSLMWVIWREMNTRTFEGDERSIHELKLLSEIVWMSKCFRCCYFHVSAWHAWFLYFHCCLVSSSLLPFSTLLVYLVLSFCPYFNFNEVYFFGLFLSRSYSFTPILVYFFEKYKHQNAPKVRFFEWA